MGQETGSGPQRGKNYRCSYHFSNFNFHSSGEPHDARQRHLRRGQELGGGAHLRADEGGQDPRVLRVHPLRGQPPRLLQRRLCVSHNFVARFIFLSFEFKLF